MLTLLWSLKNQPKAASFQVISQRASVCFQILQNSAAGSLKLCLMNPKSESTLLGTWFISGFVHLGLGLLFPDLDMVLFYHVCIYCYYFS